LRYGYWTTDGYWTTYYKLWCVFLLNVRPSKLSSIVSMQSVSTYIITNMIIIAYFFHLYLEIWQ
jgi:hypothetical protein